MSRFVARTLVPLSVSLAFLVACDSGGKGGSSKTSAGGKDLTGAEITELFAGKTVEGHHERKHYDFKSYYEPDGELRSYQGPDKKLHKAKWQVKGDDICITWQDDPEELCRKMVKGADGSYRKEKVKRNGSRLVVVTFKSFQKGNPDKL